MTVLGDRPYPLKESIKEYLEELEKRRQDEEALEVDAAEPDHEAGAAEGEESENAAAAPEEESKSESTKDESDKK